MSQNPKRKIGTPAVLMGVIAGSLALTVLLFFLSLGLVNTPPEPEDLSHSLQEIPMATPAPTVETEPVPESTFPQPEHVVATATVMSTGDLVMHKPLIDKANTGSGYDFSPIFHYAEDYIQRADYALANLETTLAGDSMPYQGFPKFNCPDELVSDAKNAGFDMMLTANNHSFDTEYEGFLRTLDVTRAAGLDTLGTMKDASEPKYLIKEINGIKIGMLCYTYETSNGQGPYPALNGNPMRGASYDNVNCYRDFHPETMYEEVELYLKEMEYAGVEATIMYIHWGPNEYELRGTPRHMNIAQTFCDMGIDVVVGGHPHVVQPMNLLTSNTDPSHKTVVLQSMGNAVSNQRLGNLESFPTAHTEDGVFFSVTFSKYSDGTVYVEDVELIPTWVNLTDQYYILPLDIAREEEWKEMFDLTDATFNKAKNSYARTMAIVGEGLQECRMWLAEQKSLREAYYMDLVLNPEKYAQQETRPPETVAETTEATEPTGSVG